MTRPPDFYTSLIQPQHADKPNFVQTVDLTTQPYAALQALLADMPRQFDLDYAVGVQLDAVGERVGISRNVPVPINQGWFAFGTANRGWGQGFWKGPYAQSYGTQAFDDETYRMLLRAKVAANSGDGSVASAKVILQTFLGAYFLGAYSPDRGNRQVPDAQPELVIYFGAVAPSIPYMLVVSRQYLPLAPAGTRFSCYAASVPGSQPFMFGVTGSGWGQGAWAQDPEILANAGVI